MKSGLRVLLLAFLLVPSLCAQTTNQAPTQAEMIPLLRGYGNGIWWNALPADRKLDFIDGYTTAMAHVRHDLLAMFKINQKELVVGDPQSASHADVMLSLAFWADQYDYDVDRIKLLNGVDDFCKDPRNTLIPIELALQYVRDTLNGENAPRDLEKQLNAWRAIVNK